MFILGRLHGGYIMNMWLSLIIGALHFYDLAMLAGFGFK